MKIKQFVNFL